MRSGYESCFRDATSDAESHGLYVRGLLTWGSGAYVADSSKGMWGFDALFSASSAPKRLRLLFFSNVMCPAFLLVAPSNPPHIVF